MQYLAWPDHGVPDSPLEFLSFTERVRTARIGMVEPILVHCSAGIGGIQTFNNNNNNKSTVIRGS